GCRQTFRCVSVLILLFFLTVPILLCSASAAQSPPPPSDLLSQFWERGSLDAWRALLHFPRFGRVVGGRGMGATTQCPPARRPFRDAGNEKTGRRLWKRVTCR